LPYIHDELETLVNKCDFSPFEALRSATLIAAETFKMESSIGSIEEGKVADLLLLNSNPLENISNTRDINLVIKNGIVYKK
jgi:imidazolonepropionase-like amidohydrolase